MEEIQVDILALNPISKTEQNLTTTQLLLEQVSWLVAVFSCLSLQSSPFISIKLRNRKQPQWAALLLLLLLSYLIIASSAP